ncbi:MAG: glycosyltransferase family 2 protein [Microgenomates group bacterium]
MKKEIIRKKQAIDLSIIIVSFNVKKLLRDCIGSVIRDQESGTGGQGINKKNKPVTELIIVDNGSTDGSVEFLRDLNQFPKSLNLYKSISLKVILNNQNLGFAKAVNQGIKASRGDYILLLNPDTQVKPDTLKRLVDFAKDHPEAGVVGAQLVNPDGSIQSSVYHFPSCWRAILEFWFGQKGAYEKYALEGKKPIEVEAVTGAAMLIPRKTFDKVGFFDERYFMYFEDLDFCRRVKKAGLKIYYLPQVKILHHHGQSAAKMSHQAYQWLCKSSKIYNGVLKYWLLTGIIWLGEKWRKRKQI